MLPSSMMPPLAGDYLESDGPGVVVRHHVPGFSERWIIPEVPVPEAAWHDGALQLLKAILEHWIAQTRRDAAVFRNLAVRVRVDRPAVGFDPDIALVEPAPPGAADLSSLRLWKAGHTPPRLAIEVVSPSHPYKDYAETPDQCAAAGVQELVVFDPKLVGPRAYGGPCRLQLWRRTEEGAFERTDFGDHPAHSRVLGAYFVATEQGTRLRISADPSAAALWPTAEEAALRDKEAALARIAELESRLHK